MRDAQNTDVLAPQADGLQRPSLRLALVVATIVVIVDQATKRWALNALGTGSCDQPDACIDLFAGIRFNLVFNTGAAFTRGSGYGPVLAVLAFFMAGFLFYLASRRVDRLGVILFAVIAGGAIGNLLDRIFRADDGLFSGAVIDFIDLGWWPVFNIADSAIVVGVVAIIVMSFLEQEPEPTAESAVESEPDSRSESESESETDGDADLEGQTSEPAEDSELQAVSTTDDRDE